jgi:integrase
MASKASNGEGSIFKDKARNRWIGAITVGFDTDGRQLRRKVTGRTRNEVRDRLDDLRKVVAAAPQSSMPAEPTVAQFLGHWAEMVLPNSVTPTTRTNYGNIVKTYIVPHVGRHRLDKLTPAHVREMLAALDAARLSPNTQRLTRSVLRRALRTAEADGLVTRNVAALVDGVRVPRPEGRTLTPEQARTLLAALDGSPLEALVTLMLSLGLRKGEALGLQWRDVDLDAGTLTVRRALKKDGKGGLYTDEPKTAGSSRTIHLPGPLADVLRRHRTRQAEQRLAFGHGWGRGWGELVFTSSIGTPMDPDRVNRAVQEITQGAGLGRWTPHELRHSAASLLIAQGVPLKVVSESLGHSSIRVTADVYGHLLEPQRREAADAMTSALWG